jgi:asparagine synthase (glutamine-hydrolysing)
MFAIFHPNTVPESTRHSTIYTNGKVTLFKNIGFPKVDTAQMSGGICAIYGEIYNGKEILEKKYDWNGSLAAGIGGRILNGDFKFLGELNGSFSVACLDERSNNLYIASDRYGSQRFYYGSLAGNVHVFPDLFIFKEYGYKSVIDLDFLTQFLTFGYIITDKTVFKDVHLMPHGSILKISQAGYQIYHYWDWHFQEENPMVGWFQIY